MRITVLYAPVVKPELPQCQAERINRYMPSWEADHPDKQCKHRASYCVDGKDLCKKHAGIAALEYLIKNGG